MNAGVVGMWRRAGGARAAQVQGERAGGTAVATVCRAALAVGGRGDAAAEFEILRSAPCISRAEVNCTGEELTNELSA